MAGETPPAAMPRSAMKTYNLMLTGEQASDVISNLPLALANDFAGDRRDLQILLDDTYGDTRLTIDHIKGLYEQCYQEAMSQQVVDLLVRAAMSGIALPPNSATAQNLNDGRAPPNPAGVPAGAPVGVPPTQRQPYRPTAPAFSPENSVL